MWKEPDAQKRTNEAGHSISCAWLTWLSHLVDFPALDLRRGSQHETAFSSCASLKVHNSVVGDKQEKKVLQEGGKVIGKKK